ncbi:hypothetical protein BP5796_02665 [Coleophoma crateriformis]|uniref:Mediator of RNA polymerase II transcription subunit 18 n=1 Tax=Coleophoma crateriformis TaxID=565419 RepID=A0A3D8SYY8_9HELO|nr:hypothetical protein BP5796_02665 [Coleophoma crateriformis]
MHELFLSAYVAFDDHTTALRILQGFCGANPDPILRRRLIWEGPKTRAVKGVNPAIIARHTPQKLPLWKYLHEQLNRQPYRVTTTYDLKKTDFSQASETGPTLVCDNLPGTLCWRDIPDPASNRPVNSRLAVDIQDERGLATTLQAMEHRFVKEFLQECFRFVYGDVIFYLSRYLEFPTGAQDSSQPAATRPLDVLPTFESLEPYDAEDKWILTATVEIQNGNDQAQLQQGIEQLMHVKSEFEGCFDFKVVDRIRFDTRVKM